MTKTQRDELRKVAMAASKGPWRAHDYHTLHEGPAVDTEIGEFICSTAIDHDGIGKKDAHHIAAFNPKVALELLDRLDVLSWQDEHTCHEKCRNVLCELRREKDFYKDWAEQLASELTSAHLRGGPKEYEQKKREAGYE